MRLALGGSPNPQGMFPRPASSQEFWLSWGHQTQTRPLPPSQKAPQEWQSPLGGPASMG